MADRGARRGGKGARRTTLMPILLILVLVLVAPSRALAARISPDPAVAAAADAGNATASRDDDFDFYFLVRQYPPTFCNDHRCSHSPPRGFAFTIHGLWPQRADGSWPEFCAGPDGGPGGGLSLWRLRDLLPRLARHWPSWTTSDRQFWQHEWARHGACAAAALTGEKSIEPGRGQHAFFAAVLDLHRRYPVEHALDSAGIEPSSSRRYAVSDVVEAVRKEHGVRPHVTCDFHGNLAEVWYCVAKDGKGAVDCGPDGGAAALAALAAAEEERRRQSSAAPSNAYCRTVALPPPRSRGAAETVADEAPIVTVALAILSAAVAVWRGGGQGGGEARRPLIAAS